MSLTVSRYIDSSSRVSYNLPLTSPAQTRETYKFEKIPGCFNRAADNSNPFLTLLSIFFGEGMSLILANKKTK